MSRGLIDRVKIFHIPFFSNKKKKNAQAFFLARGSSSEHISFLLLYTLCLSLSRPSRLLTLSFPLSNPLVLFCSSSVLSLLPSSLSCFPPLVSFALSLLQSLSLALPLSLAVLSFQMGQECFNFRDRFWLSTGVGCCVVQKMKCEGCKTMKKGRAGTRTKTKALTLLDRFNYSE